MGKPDIIYLCEVVINNRFSGRRFMLRSSQEIREFGLSVASVKLKARQKENNVLYGIRLTPVDALQFDENEAIKHGYAGEWRDISDLFLRHPTRFRTRSKPIIGQVMEGKYVGEQIALFSLSDISPYFPVESVRKAIVSKTTYCGLIWRYGKDYLEAEAVYQGEILQHDILLSLNQERATRRGGYQARRKYASGYRNMTAHLIQAVKALSRGEYEDGLILIHRALGVYQTLLYRQTEDSVRRRVSELADQISPKADKNTSEVIRTKETQAIIKRLITQLKRRE